MTRPVLPNDPLAQSRAAPAALPTPELSVVVPTYRESGNIVPFVAALAAALQGLDWEVIFVDDDSGDGTIDKVRALGDADRRIRGIRRIGRRGLAGACIEGMLSSSAPIVAVMDCDLQHDETILPEMRAAIDHGAGLVVATRYQTGGSAGDGFTERRAAISRVATRVTNALLKTNVSDPMSGFFMIRRADFEALAPRLSTAGFKILLDILASRARDMVIAEVPYSFRARLTGESKLGAHVAAEFAALLVSKVTGDRISPRFFLFALVGTSGIAVHLAALKAALSGLALSFEAAQTLAAFTAMTWNFFLNNALTYRDRRLTGAAMLKGLLSFYIVCSVGTIANVGVAQFVHDLDPSWWRAGLAGALMAAVFNYAVTSVVTWRK